MNLKKSNLIEIGYSDLRNSCQYAFADQEEMDNAERAIYGNVKRVWQQGDRIDNFEADSKEKVTKAKVEPKD